MLALFLKKSAHSSYLYFCFEMPRFVYENNDWQIPFATIVKDKSAEICATSWLNQHHEVFLLKCMHAWTLWTDLVGTHCFGRMGSWAEFWRCFIGDMSMNSWKGWATKLLSKTIFFLCPMECLHVLCGSSVEHASMWSGSLRIWWNTAFRLASGRLISQTQNMWCCQRKLASPPAYRGCWVPGASGRLEIMSKWEKCSFEIRSEVRPWKHFWTKRRQKFWKCQGMNFLAEVNVGRFWAATSCGEIKRAWMLQNQSTQVLLHYLHRIMLLKLNHYFFSLQWF